MNKKTILNIAKKYLRKNDMNFLEPGELGRLDGLKQEVIFLDAQILDPNVAIIIPEDIRVWVNIETKEVTLIYQM